MAELDQIERPEDIFEDDYEALKSHLVSAIQRSIGDPLMTLSDEQDKLLIRLAFNDDYALSKLEMHVRDAIRLRGDGEPTARRFNLMLYRKKAKQIRTQLAEQTAISARIKLRNKMDDDPSVPHSEVAEHERAAGGKQELAAKLASNATHLKSLGILEARRKGRIWKDTFHNNYLTDWGGREDDRVIAVRPVDDTFLLNVYEWLLMSDIRLSTGLSRTETEAAIHNFANQDERNEPQEWLRGLEWDGKLRLATWLMTVYGVEDDDAGYHRAVGRNWIVSMVARIMSPGCKCDTMPVLLGPQGNYKSTSLSILGGKWYATINTSADKMQDFLMSLRGLMVAEIAELDAIKGTAKTRVKALLSTAEDVYRPPYGRTVATFKRTAVMCGSTNDSKWHGDESGGRRFWSIVTQGKCDTEWLRENRDQLFAEAMVLFQRGERWDVVPEEEANRRVMEHLTADPWDDRIQSWIEASELWTGAPTCDAPKVFGDPSELELHKHWGTVITTSRILEECLKLPIERHDKRVANRVATIMRNMGFEQQPVRASKVKLVRCWVVTDVAECSSDQKLLPFKGLDA
jgi:predicted P-loop ATPase